MRMLVGLLSILLLTSCGKKTHRRTEVLPLTFSNEAEFLKKQNDQCSTKSFQETDAIFDTNFFFANSFTKTPTNFFPYIQSRYLKDAKTIKSTTWGEEVESEVIKSKMMYRTLKSKSEVEICPEEKELARDSIESAALNANYVIKQTNSFIAKVFPELEIAPVDINISPSIKTSFVSVRDGKKAKVSAFMTDNAFYMPYNNSITFLPHSRSLKPFMKAYYWEIPMIAAHEYGHHIFNTLSKKLGRRSMTGCMGAMHVEHVPDNKREVSIHQIEDSYNEGFADLIALYALPGNLADLNGVRCFAVSRDPKSPVLVNGKEKKITVAADSYFSETDEGVNSCDNPNYQEIHTFGAVVAHNIHLFLSKYSLSDEDKLKVLFSWVKSLDSERAENKTLPPREYFEKTFSNFFKVAMDKLQKEYDAENCHNIKAIFPGIKIEQCQNFL